MADKQISDLTSASVMTDGSLFVIEQGGAAKSANWGMVKNYISTGVADQYSSSATYNVGDYVIYNGQLYRCTTAITTAESWTAAHWTATVLGDDVGELKSATEYIYDALDSINRILMYLWWEQGSFNSGGELVSDTRIRTPYIHVAQYNDVTVYCDSGFLYELDRFDENKTLIETISWNNTSRYIDLTNCAYVRFILCKTGNTPIVPSEGTHLQVYGYTASYEWKQFVESNYIHDGGYVTSNTMSTVLSDANNAVANKCYTIRFTNDEENILPNLPFSRTKLNETDLLLLVTFPASAYKLQLLFARNGDMWARMGVISNNHWFPWYKDGVNYDSGETIHVGTGQEYTKLTDAIKYAFEHANTTVIVHPGTYDIVSEMGSSYWQNFSGYSDLTHAKIGNGAHFIFSPDALVTCQYTGSNTAVNTLYSPFNSLDGYEGDFTIEGMTLVVSGCRYAIHDDVGASTVEQTHRYINCDITNDKRCIGAGLGAYMTVEMRDCVFRSTGSAGNNPVSWHNSGGGTTGKSSIVMTGCYITGAGNNTAQFLYHGISTKLTRVMVTNNSLGAEPFVGPAESADVVNNIELIAWNNVIRGVADGNVIVENVNYANSDSVPANGVKSFSINVSKTGYTPIGIAGITGSGTSGLVLQEYYMSSTNAVIYFKNTTSNDITPSNIRVSIIYSKIN